MAVDGDDVAAAEEVGEKDRRELFFVAGDGGPGFGRLWAKIGKDGGERSHELVARGREAEFCLEVVPSVEVVAEAAECFHDGARGVENCYVRTVDLGIWSVIFGEVVESD